MKIILDPSRDGCIIWFPDRNTIKFMHGTPKEICQKIYGFSTHYNEETGKVEQTVKISLDHNGIGITYQDILQNEYNLEIHIIQIEKELFMF